MNELISLFLHVDKHLITLFNEYGLGIYAVLFLIIFLETGVVVTPFLPGDSLLFAAGALTAQTEVNIFILCGILIVAAILGDSTNYFIGTVLSEKANRSGKIPLVKKSHLDKTERYFQKYGSKTIILARFIPIVRTIAPFFAGIGKMNYNSFIKNNILGGVIWVTSFLFLGYFFGDLPAVKSNFSYVILGIIAISLLPIVLEVFMMNSPKNPNQDKR